jgi:glycosyltransferase involved in cell wall biosynthesis
MMTESVRAPESPGASKGESIRRSRRGVPALSVVMPVHNAAPYLDLSIRSILGQTFRDFELVLLDDASTDDSGQLLDAWARRDRRIHVIHAPARLGLVGSADLAVRQARAPICARMDADDVSHPDRLLIEWGVLARDSDVVLVGTLWEGIDAGGRTVRPRDRWRLVHADQYAPFPHGSIMFRREAFVTVGGYRAACAFWEDLDLYYRLATRGRIVVLPDVLYRYRFHTDSTSTNNSPVRVTQANLMHRCAARQRAGEDYAGLLPAAATPPGDRWVASARALYSTRAGRLWAGHPPGLLELFGHLRIWPEGGMPRLLILALCGETSPRLLRSLLRILIRLRDRAAATAVRDGVPVEWRFGQRPSDLISASGSGALATVNTGRARGWAAPAPGRRLAESRRPGP